ncbi:MAG: T9SS type A sorting domain-containing protein [Luteibaculum sp.]
MRGKFLLAFVCLCLRLLAIGQPVDIGTSQATFICADMEGVKISGPSYLDEKFLLDSVFYYHPIPNSPSRVFNQQFNLFVIDDVHNFWVAGYNATGMLGNGSRESQSALAQHPFLPRLETLVLFSDGYSALAIDRELGRLFLWGFVNDELFWKDSVISENEYLEPLHIFKDLPPLKDVKVGNTHGLVLSTDGLVLGWGQATEGRLTSDYNGFIKRPRLLNFTGIREISTGWEHSLVLDSAGVAYAFGLNLYGECGINPDSIYFTSDPHKLPVENVKAVAAGRSLSYVLDDQGKVYAFGLGSFGGMGNGDSVVVNFNPNQVPFPEPIQQIVAKDLAMVAIGVSGNFYVLGLDNGRFGQNTTDARYYSPLLITPSCSSTAIHDHVISSILVYPNPSETGIFQIQGLPSNQYWEVYDALGNLVLRGNTRQINLRNASKGMYFFKSVGLSKKLFVQ